MYDSQTSFPNHPATFEHGTHQCTDLNLTFIFIQILIYLSIFYLFLYSANIYLLSDFMDQALCQAPGIKEANSSDLKK